VRIHLHNEDHWTRSDSTIVSGNAFLDGKHRSSIQLAERISETDNADDLKRLLSRANGFFSVIHENENNVHVAVDHVRSWPVFYGVTDDVYVSDSAEWIHKVGGRRGYDPVAGTELLFACFVSGGGTLSRDVRQVRAGELVTIDVDRSTPSVREERYFTYTPVESSSGINKDELDEVLVETIERLIEYVDGRTILLGLSRGYDSRLIALMLRRLGHDNTVAYTTRTASADRQEMRAAKEVADDLGFEHIEVTSDPSDYQNFEGSKQMKLIEDIGYLSEYPHINKVVLRDKLEEAGIDPDSVVHVLGHTVLGAGTFLPEWVTNRHALQRNELLDLMWDLHYRNWETMGEHQWRPLFEARMMKQLSNNLFRTGDVEPTPDAIAGFEQWYWQERLPKYIIARREYEYLGFDIWYPLLDRALYSLFGSSAYGDRVGKQIFEEYVRDLDTEIRGQQSDPGTEFENSSRSLSEIAWNQTTRTVQALPDPVTESVRSMYHKYKSQNAYYRDPRFSIVSKDWFDSISFPNVNSRTLYRTLLLLYLYENRFFEFPVKTEYDHAIYQD